MKFPLLLDAYGALLSDRKREILDYYFNEDYSLAEISELTGISRQGVRDSIKKSKEEIEELEDKLGTVEKSAKARSLLQSVLRDLDVLVPETSAKDAEDGNRLQTIIDKLVSLSVLLEPGVGGQE